MTNVLRRKKNSAGQRLEKDTWLNQSRNRLEPKTADRFHFLADFIELRNAIGIKVETIEAVEIFGAGMLAVRGSKRLPDLSAKRRVRVRCKAQRESVSRVYKSWRSERLRCGGRDIRDLESRDGPDRAAQRIAIETHIDMVAVRRFVVSVAVIILVHLVKA